MLVTRLNNPFNSWPSLGPLQRLGAYFPYENPVAPVFFVTGHIDDQSYLPDEARNEYRQLLRDFGKRRAIGFELENIVGKWAIYVTRGFDPWRRHCGIVESLPFSDLKKAHQAMSKYIRFALVKIAPDPFDTDVHFRAGEAEAEMKREAHQINNQNYRGRKAGVPFIPIRTEHFDMICARTGFRCSWCRKAKPLTIDHIVPLSEGGAHVLENLQPLCVECNSSKGTKSHDFRRFYAEDRAGQGNWRQIVQCERRIEWRDRLSPEEYLQELDLDVEMYGININKAQEEAQ